MNLPRILLAISIAFPIWGQNTVVLSGRITNALTGQPVEGAAITLNGGRTSYADAGGNYSFAEATPGSAQIAIRAEGFVAFEKTNPEDASFPIPAERFERHFSLTPAASITGIVTSDEAGGIPRNIVVKVFQEVFAEGVRQFAPRGEREGEREGERVGIASVNPDGTYRLTGLEPGRYLISVGPPSLGVSITVRKPDSAQALEDYVPTYYPGTTDFSAAIPISVAAGESRTADLHARRVPLFRAAGEIESKAAEVKKGRVEVASTSPGVSRIFGGEASAPGAFVVDGLPPGQYTVGRIVFQGPMVANEGGSGVTFSMSLWDVNLPFAITDHDVEGLRLVPLPPRSPLAVNGSFRMANESAPLPPGLAVQFAYPEPGGRSDLIEAAPNGTFWLTGVPEEYSVRPVVPPGYAVTEIRYGGGNYLNSRVPMRGDTLDSSLTIVLTDQPGAVTGVLVDGDQKPVAAHVVLAPETLPSDFDFRAFRVVSTDSHGAFIFSGLARGRYKAVVLTGDDRKRDHDLAILRDKLAVADTFEVTAGQSMTIRLRP